MQGLQEEKERLITYQYHELAKDSLSSQIAIENESRLDHEENRERGKAKTVEEQGPAARIKAILNRGKDTDQSQGL